MNILNFNNRPLIEDIYKHHQIYDYQIKDISSENILTNFFEKNDQQVYWEIGSHKPGSDVYIFTVDKQFGYSVKSAKEPSKNGKYLKISSYRTESNPTWEDKKKSIIEIEKDIHGYVVFSRQESKKENFISIIYSVYLIEPELLSIESFNVSPTGNGDYKGNNNHGVELYCRKTMSSQIWLSVPMELIKNSNFVKTICNAGPFEIKRRKKPILKVA